MLLRTKKGKVGFMFLKMDMEKAFDRVEWNLILVVMQRLGFNQTWINWIKICISSSSFSVLINGSPFGRFSPARGLRQGDPLSPFLFILGSEVLSRLLFKEEVAGNLKGLKIARNCPAISHLLYADDLLIFGKASCAEASCISSCFEKYTRWSGQSINANKSSIHFSKNTSPGTIRNILPILPFTHNPAKSVYLGLPILYGNSKSKAFNEIVEKVQKRIEGWRAKSLSQASRTILIKSVAASIPTYAMSTFLLPRGICNNLDKMFKNFWWGFPLAKARNLSLKSWDSLCLPRALGGMGFRRMKDVNQALIAKLGWKVLTNFNSPWVSQLQGKYLYSFPFLSSSPSSASTWLWKGILKSRHLLSQGACYKIHRLSSLPVWDSPWIPTFPSFKPISINNSSNVFPHLWLKIFSLSPQIPGIFLCWLLSLIPLLWLKLEKSNPSSLKGRFFMDPLCQGLFFSLFSL
jgi:hypothetical protein